MGRGNPLIVGGMQRKTSLLPLTLHTTEKVPRYGASLDTREETEAIRRLHLEFASDTLLIDRIPEDKSSECRNQKV